jgi:hypothetical protein
MSASDLRVRQDAGAFSVEDGNVAADRIIFMTSNAGGVASINSPVISGLNANAAVFVQQVSSGSAIVPVVADTFEPGGAGTGFVVRLTAAAPMPANADWYVFIARLN